MASVILHIIRYEFLKTIRDNSLSLLLIITGTLVFYSLHTGNEWLEFRREVIREIRQAEQEQRTTHLKDLKEYKKTGKPAGLDVPANPVAMYAGKRIYTVKTPSSRCIFSTGQSDISGYYQLFTGINDQELLV